MDQSSVQNPQQDEAAVTNGFLPSFMPRWWTNQGIQAASGTQLFLQGKLGQPADPIGLSREFCTNQGELSQAAVGTQPLTQQLLRQSLTRSTEDPHSQRNIGEISEQEALRSKKTEITKVRMDEQNGQLNREYAENIERSLQVRRMMKSRRKEIKSETINAETGEIMSVTFFVLTLVLMVFHCRVLLEVFDISMLAFLNGQKKLLAFLVTCALLLFHLLARGKISEEKGRALMRKRERIKEEKQALLDENDGLKHEIQEKIKLINEKDQMIISNIKVFKAESQRLKHEIEVNEQKMKFNLAAIEADEWRLKREIEEKKLLMKSSLEAFEKRRLKVELKEKEHLMKKSSLDEFEFEIWSLMQEIEEKEQLMKSNREAFEAENGRLRCEIEEKEQLMKSNVETLEAKIRCLNNEIESLKDNNVLMNLRLQTQSAKLAELRNKYDELKQQNQRTKKGPEFPQFCVFTLQKGAYNTI